MKKRIALVLLAFCMLGTPVTLFAGLSTALPRASAAVAQVDLSDYADGSEYIGADGIVYRVLKTPATMLEYVKGKMSGSFILAADMDMGGTTYNFPMFGGEAFSGIFDGNGYSITNFVYDSSVNANNGLLFHSLAGAPVVKNVTVGSASAPIEATFTKGNGANIGGIAGTMKSADARTLLSGLTVYSNMTYKDKREENILIGGIVGQGAPCTIEDCHFYGSVVFDASAAMEGKNTFVGGMMGRHNQVEGTVTIKNCTNHASVDLSPRTNNQYTRVTAGGIVGEAAYPTTVVGCENSGAMVSSHIAGGIVGHIQGASGATHAYKITDCTNTGTVTAGNFAGGILGQIKCAGGASSSPLTFDILRCINVGTVTASNEVEADNESGNTAAGGIVGSARYGYYTIRDCASVGDIASSGKHGSGASTACGIVGYLYVNAEAEHLSVMENCIATGTLTYGNAAWSGSALAVVSTNSASKGYLLEVKSCYYNFGEAVLLGGINMKVAESSTVFEERPLTEFADGTVLSLLGEGWEQGENAAYPTPKQDASASVDTGLQNLIAKGFTTGYYKEDGTKNQDAAYQSHTVGHLTAGDVLYVGAVRKGQPVYGHTFDASGASKGALRPLQTTSLLGGYELYIYTVPEGVASVSLTFPAQRTYTALVTVNQEFSVNAYYEYFGISAMSGRDTSALWQKKALFAGDSISYGYSDTSISGTVRAWAGRLGYDYDMEWINASVSGATITNRTENQVLPQLTPYLGQRFDYVILQGGVNDANVNYCNAPVGAMSASTDPADFDASTYAGALEELFYTARVGFPEAKIGFVLTFTMPRVPHIDSHYPDYIEVTKQIAEKWDIELLDLHGSDEINNTVLATSTNTYVADGVHPNASGYDRLTPYIAAFMETMEAPSTPVTPPEPDTGEGGTGEPSTKEPDTGKPPIGDQTSGEGTSGTEPPTEPPTQAPTETPTEAPSDIGEEPKEKGSNTGVIAAVAIAAVAMIGAAVFFVMKKKR